MPYISFGNLDRLRQNNPAWKLLTADNAPFICAFLHQVFIMKNVREMSESRLMVKLEDFMLNTNFFDDKNISSKDILTSWTEKSWLRKFFIGKTDEVHYDLTSWSQKAIDWISSLEQDDFIGTESRLLMFFQLIDNIAENTNVDPEKRIAELEKRKKDIDLEIKAIKNGNLSILEPVQIKDRFMQAMQTGRDILSDFREVEENFRSLYRQMREKITSWTGGKGSLLAEFFEDNDKIGSSEQGRSFYAFYEFLSSQTARDNFYTKIDEILKLQAVIEIPNSRNIKNIASDWAEGSEHVMSTLQDISSQLNRYISDSYLEEERRINQIIGNIEKSAMSLRHSNPSKIFEAYVDTVVPEINLQMEKPLFTPVIKSNLSVGKIEQGKSFGDDNILYSQNYIDKTKIKSQINDCIKIYGKVSLKEITEKYPVKHGLSEIVAYVAIADAENDVEFDYSSIEKIFWKADDGKIRSADMPKIIFKDVIKQEV